MSQRPAQASEHNILFERRQALREDFSKYPPNGVESFLKEFTYMCKTNPYSNAVLNGIWKINKR